MYSFEKQYAFALQSLEFAVVQVYRQNNELVDEQVDTALEWVYKTYRAEDRGRTLPDPLEGVPLETAEHLQATSEVLLGRAAVVGPDGEMIQSNREPMTLDEVAKCLKRLRKSVRLWTKTGGRTGYLAYVDQFFPK